MRFARLSLVHLIASLALAGSVTLPGSDARADDDPAAAAAREHFARQQAQGEGQGKEQREAAPGSADPTASADAMVAYFTEETPEDVTVVARRRHVDLDIRFDFDSAELSEEGVEQLDTAGQALKDPALQGHRFMLAGHTDKVGDPTYNRDLSRRRAESAKRYLIEKYDIAPERLETQGFGSEHPKDESDTPAARRVNRRVALEMLD